MTVTRDDLINAALGGWSVTRAGVRMGAWELEPHAAGIAVFYDPGWADAEPGERYLRATFTHVVEAVAFVEREGT